VAREIQWQLHRAFETVGCSCNPLRAEAERLDEEYEALREELDAGPISRRREELWRQVREIDAREHPDLNNQAVIAGPFLRLWLFDRIMAGDTPDLNNQAQLAKAYAEAWRDGWRPAVKGK
jgi:hypothetical protein